MRRYDLRTLAVAAKRLGVCGVAALALAHLQVAQAAKLPDFSKTGVNYTGKTATFGATGNGTTWGSTVPISPPLGGGWQFAGNYGIPASATGPTMTMSANGNVFFAGTKYPFQAGYQVPSSAVTDALKGLGGLLGGPLGIGLAIAGGGMPYVLDWLQRSGGRVNSDGSIDRQDTTVCTVAPCYEYKSDLTWSSYPYTYEPWSLTRQAACTAQLNFMNAHPPNGSTSYSGGTLTNGGTTCYTINCYNGNCNASQYGYSEKTILQRERAPSSASWLPSSMDDIAPYMDPTTRDPRVISEILNKGGDIQLPAPTVTGPSSIQGPEKSTNNPDGTRTVEKTVYNFTTNNNQITNTSNVTTTTIYAPDNSVVSTTTQTQTPTDEDQKPSECDKDSKGAACANMDVPEDKIPKSEKTVTYAPENLGFGSGQCPAPIGWSDSLGSHQIDLASYCNMLTTWVKPVVIALALMLAFFIVAPIKGD